MNTWPILTPQEQLARRQRAQTRPLGLGVVYPTFDGSEVGTASSHGSSPLTACPLRDQNLIRNPGFGLITGSAVATLHRKAHLP